MKTATMKESAMPAPKTPMEQLLEDAVAHANAPTIPSELPDRYCDGCGKYPPVAWISHETALCRMCLVDSVGA